MPAPPACAAAPRPARSTNVQRPRSKKQQRLRFHRTPPLLTYSCTVKAALWSRSQCHARVPWPATAPLSDFRTLRAAGGARRTCTVRSQCLTCAGRKARSPCRSAASTARRNLLARGEERAGALPLRRGDTPPRHLFATTAGRWAAAAERSRAQQSATLQASTTVATAVAAAVAVQCAGRLLCPATAHHLPRCETHCCMRCAALRCARRCQALPGVAVAWWRAVRTRLLLLLRLRTVVLSIEGKCCEGHRGATVNDSSEVGAYSIYSFKRLLALTGQHVALVRTCHRTDGRTCHMSQNRWQNRRD